MIADDVERWLPIAGYEGMYEVSSHGRVRALRFINGKTNKLLPMPRILRLDPVWTGHLRVTLQKNDERDRRRVHHIVLETFVGPCPPGMEGAHDDGNPANNRLNNLAWKTHIDNLGDRVRHGTILQGEKVPTAKLTEETVRLIRTASGTHREIALRFGISRPQTSKIIRREAWAHVA